MYGRTELTDSHLYAFFRSFSLVFSYFLTFSFFEYTIIIFIIVYTIKISRPHDPVQTSDKILVSSQKFLSDIPPHVFTSPQKCQIITKLDFLHFLQKCKSQFYSTIARLFGNCIVYYFNPFLILFQNVYQCNGGQFTFIILI